MQLVPPLMVNPLATAATPLPARLPLAIAVAMLLLHGVLAWVVRSPGIETAQDDAKYVLLSRSVADFHYREQWRVGTPTHSQYPPGYPGLLAAWSVVAGDSFNRLVLTGTLASVASLALVAVMTGTMAGPSIALAALIPLVINPYLLENAGELRSETMFMMWCFLTLILATMGERKLSLVGAGAAAIIAALTRPIGVALIAALGLHWLLQRRYKAVGALTLASAATIGLWLAWTVVAPEKVPGTSYVADLVAIPLDAQRSLLAKLLDPLYPKVPNYLGSALPYRLPFPTIPGTRLDNLFGAGLVVVGLTGGLVIFWKRWRVASLFLLFYGAVLAAFPWTSGRFLEPIVPLVLVAILVTLNTLVGRVSRKGALAAVWALSMVLTVNGVVRSTPILSYRVHCHTGSEMPPPHCLTVDQASFFSALSYIRDYVPTDAVFLAAKPEPLFYYTGRKSVLRSTPFGQPPDRFVPLLRAAGVDHVLLGSLQTAEIYSYPKRLLANCDQFEVLEFFPPRTYLFRLLEIPDPSRGLATCEAVEAFQAANIDRNFSADARW